MLFLDSKIRSWLRNCKLDPENAIEIKNVSKKFLIHHERKNSLFEYLATFFKRDSTREELQVLNDISFSVKKGEVLGILGLNGSGKTTLLKIISKIYSPDSGSVSVDGQVMPLLELGTGFHPELTARDNIIVYGVILGFNKNEIIKKIENIISFAELEKFLDTKLKNFSSGMGARLAFSTAIEVDPDILLIDEVLSVGDIKFQEKSSQAIMKFKEMGKTLVIVSHSIKQIIKMCDRVIWIDNGKICEDGEPSMVVSKYEQNLGNKT